MKTIAMIPARMGSQRLKKKNLRELGGVPLVSRGVRRCHAAGCFDEIWINSEHADFAALAEREGARFHQRPEDLGNDKATSEQYVHEFLKHHPCDWLFQVHSIAPLLGTEAIRGFVEYTTGSGHDVVLSYIPEQIECAMDGEPINFTFREKTNSQELTPVQRITWSITAWRPATYIDAFERGRCATYAGEVGFYPVDPVAGHVIKTEADLRFAEALLPLVEDA